MEELFEYYQTKINTELKTIYDKYKTNLNKHFIDNISNIITEYAEYEKLEQDTIKEIKIRNYGVGIYSYTSEVTQGFYDFEDAGGTVFVDFKNDYANWHLDDCDPEDYITYDLTTIQQITSRGFSFSEFEKLKHKH